MDRNQELLTRIRQLQEREAEAQEKMKEQLERHRLCMLERTGGTETSQYPQEEKEIIDSLSSGDRTGKSPNRCCYGNVGVVGPVIG